MQILDVIEEFCETDPLVFLVMAAVVIAVLLAGLLLAIFWPLDRIRITEDRHPFAEMLPRKLGDR